MKIGLLVKIAIAIAIAIAIVFRGENRNSSDIDTDSDPDRDSDRKRYCVPYSSMVVLNGLGCGEARGRKGNEWLKRENGRYHNFLIV